MTGSFPHPFPLISAEFKIMYLRSLRERDLAYPYAVTELGSDDMIGIMDLFRKDLFSPLEIGYWIAEPYWGKGYAYEAGVLDKLGFEQTGEREQYFSMARMKKSESLIYEKHIDNLEIAAQ